MAASGLACFDVKALPFIFPIVQNYGRALARLTECGSANRCKSGSQQHLLNRLPIIKKLMFVALTEIHIHDFHWRFLPTATPIHQLLRSINISSQHELRVRHHDPKAAAQAKNAMDLSSDALSLRKRKMLQHVFAKDTVE